MSHTKDKTELVDAPQRESVAEDGTKRINGRFAPGVSGNPGGRGKRAFNLTKIIQARTDPDEMYNILIAIMRGQGVRVMDGGSFAPEGPINSTVPIQMPSVKDQLKAWQMLAEWGFVKPPTQKQVSIDDNRSLPRAGFDERKLTGDQLATLAGILDSARSLPAHEDGDDD
jgi:hypothetical protein